MDRERFGRDWEPQPPLVGNKCMRHQVSCVVTATGDVTPCVGVTIALDNIRNNKLAHILKHSEVINNLKNYRNMIKGVCRTCEKAEECYGCRGAAYQMTGDYLASDPTCWRNKEEKAEG
jgi:radical SAM protein with 4Fe4S-binding SPASM domain